MMLSRASSRRALHPFFCCGGADSKNLRLDGGRSKDYGEISSQGGLTHHGGHFRSTQLVQGGRGGH